MKKKIRIPIIPIILVIIAIIIVVVVINKNSKTSEEQLLQGEYDKLSSMQSYQFTEEKDSKNITIVAKDGDKTAIDSYADGQHTTTVIKDNKTYYILHDKEEYYIYNSTNIENSIVIDWIKDVIGKGGETINKIIDATGVKIDIKEDGLVCIYSNDSEKAKQALDMVEDIVREVVVGGIYYGQVTRIATFGAFVDLGFGGKEGLLHISKISKERIKNVEDVLHVGDKVTVKVLEIDDQGRINLTAILNDDKKEEKAE